MEPVQMLHRLEIERYLYRKYNAEISLSIDYTNYPPEILVNVIKFEGGVNYIPFLFIYNQSYYKVKTIWL